MAKKGKKLIEAYKTIDRNRLVELPAALQVIKTNRAHGLNAMKPHVRTAAARAFADGPICGQLHDQACTFASAPPSRTGESAHRGAMARC